MAHAWICRDSVLTLVAAGFNISLSHKDVTMTGVSQTGKLVDSLLNAGPHLRKSSQRLLYHRKFNVQRADITLEKRARFLTERMLTICSHMRKKAYTAYTTTTIPK